MVDYFFAANILYYTNFLYYYKPVFVSAMFNMGGGELWGNYPEVL